MKIQFGRIAILVNDYDEAYRFYEKNFGCKKFFDLEDETGQRFLHISFGSDRIAGLWLVKAETEEQKSRVGDQTGGSPLFVVYTDAFEELAERLNGNGVKTVMEKSVTDEYISMSVLDLYGNEIVIVEQKK